MEPTLQDLAAQSGVTTSQLLSVAALVLAGNLEATLTAHHDPSGDLASNKQALATAKSNAAAAEAMFPGLQAAKDAAHCNKKMIDAQNAQNAAMQAALEAQKAAAERQQIINDIMMGTIHNIF